jgi:hypothetical protein
MIARARRILGLLREIAAEADYAQRRLLEIRIGIPFTPETERALARAEIARLETLYAHPHPELEPVCDPERVVRDGWILEPPARR